MEQSDNIETLPTLAAQCLYSGGKILEAHPKKDFHQRTVTLYD